MQHIKIQRLFAAPIETVWERYTDHQGWARLMGLGRVTLQPEGHPSPNGVGCVRSIAVAGIETVAEEITEFVPPIRMQYRIVRGGGPLRDHAGEVLFTEEGDGTRVIWRCQFRSVVPGLGPLLHLCIGGFFRLILSRLAAELIEK